MTAYDPLDPNGNTVKLTKNFTCLARDQGTYTCGPAKLVPATNDVERDLHLLTVHGKEKFELLCFFVIILQSRDHSLHFLCLWLPKQCHLCQILQLVGANNTRKDNTSLLQCTHHMCPVRVHWHVKTNYKEYWRVKIAIINFNYRMNYLTWTLVIQHPNLKNVTQVFNLNCQPLVPYASINGTGMLYGMKYFNDVLIEAGVLGNVQSEVLLQKDLNTFTFKQGWRFPRKSCHS
ncbi:hypothetical protein Tsubulata_023864 [Turnera subulata]|uniref:COBRA C-terminal domain-containing protein n=1 Tax=Turnera subulata TaxID=218843 RepID=A0A9Q0J3N5_9ROSI|nr:hypothetical protein Tsubulata_023864 [Turnera subulata]